MPDADVVNMRKPAVSELNRQFSALYTNNLIRAQPGPTDESAGHRNWTALRVKVRQ